MTNARAESGFGFGLNAAAQLFFVPAYPFWSLTIIAIDVVALYGLCVYGRKEDVTGG